ncbi:hypothetical protein BDV95DRAFT_319483 [Massariosphaeria phaeospora]|uniref:Secreted protein n=1 Tax=Massariosphaeria phaeospora TaxID=100035 RepID=A0A7C8I9N0_9PLEO|nr:hypothetical protein BDV95DRAFT_319483 [Massariosphaeria phaeospora]
MRSLGGPFNFPVVPWVLVLVLPFNICHSTPSIRHQSPLGAPSRISTSMRSAACYTGSVQIPLGPYLPFHFLNVTVLRCLITSRLQCEINCVDQARREDARFSRNIRNYLLHSTLGRLLPILENSHMPPKRTVRDKRGGAQNPGAGNRHLQVMCAGVQTRKRKSAVVLDIKTAGSHPGSTLRPMLPQVIWVGSPKLGAYSSYYRPGAH